MGYPLDLFVDQGHIDEEFKCCICNDVMKAPIMSESCEHIFCTDCIKTWMHSSDTCPIDRQPISGLRAPIRSYMNMYNRLKLNCSYHGNGCSTVSNIESIEPHHDSCDYKPNAIKPCVRNCGASIKMMEISTHDCFEYLKQELATYEKHKQETFELKIKLATKDLEIKALRNYKQLPPCIIVKRTDLNWEAINHFYIEVPKSQKEIRLPSNEVRNNGKFDVLSGLLDALRMTQAIIFCSTYDMVGWLSVKMREKRYSFSSIDGEMEPEDSMALLDKFRAGFSRVLITTYLLTQEIIAVRGISLVINFDLPAEPQEYFDRVIKILGNVGGSSRSKGLGINLVTKEDHSLLKRIEEFNKIKIEKMPSNLLALF